MHSKKMFSDTMNGQRLKMPSSMNENVYELITKCWKQEPKERIEIDGVIAELQSLLQP